MRSLCLFVLLAFGAAAAQTQVGSGSLGPPDLVILKKAWEKEVRPAENSRLDSRDETFDANDAYNESVLARQEAARENAARGSKGERVMRVPPSLIRRPPSNRLTQRYSYTIKVQNTGDRAVRLVEWAYVFVETGTGKEVGRHRHVSRVKIAPGKSKELTGHSTSPLIQVLDAGSAAGDSKPQLTEQVIISRVEYEAGQPWIRPPQ